MAVSLGNVHLEPYNVNSKPSRGAMLFFVISFFMVFFMVFVTYLNIILLNERRFNAVCFMVSGATMGRFYV